MSIRSFVVVAAMLLASLAHPQEPLTPIPPVTLHELNRLPWSHIGSPPSDANAVPHRDEWPREAARFVHAFESIKRSWTVGKPVSISDLRFGIQQYEDLVKTIADTSGYGNLILADCARRLSITLIIEYVLSHPSEVRAVSEMVNHDRARLLDSAAVGNTLAEELKLAPPSGSWHLLESTEEMDLVFRATGSSLAEQSGRLVLGTPSTAALIRRRDLAGVMLRLLESDAFECVHLPGLLEFRKLGGRPEDLDPGDVRKYLRVMERDMRRFQFPLLGINMLRLEHLIGITQGFDPSGNKVNTFTRRALE